MSIEDFYNGVREHIRVHGRSIVNVPPSHHYTIGNYLRCLPELFVIGNFEPKKIAAVLNVVSEKIIERGSAFDEPEKIDIGAKYPVCVIPARDEAKKDYTIQAGQFIGREDYDVAQVVLCDPKGIWPWETACQQAFRVSILRRTHS